MPRCIKPKMSKDELNSFHSVVESVEYDDGEVIVTIDDGYCQYPCVSFNEKDLEDMLQFIRRNKL